MSATIDQLGLDFNAAQQAAQRGMARAMPKEEELWRFNYEFVISQLASQGREFTADDIRRIVGDPPAWVHPNAAGALVNRMAKVWVGPAGERLKVVGYAKSSRVCGHGNLQRIWKAAQ